MTLSEMRDRIGSLKDNFEDISRDIVLDSVSQDLIVEIQKDQMMHGEDAYGNKIEPEYSNFYYARFKNRINPRAGFGVPDLRSTGSFYNQFYLNEYTLRVNSMDDKTGSLVQEYGESIFGLNEGSLEKYCPYFKRRLKEKVETILES